MVQYTRMITLPEMAKRLGVTAEWLLAEVRAGRVRPAHRGRRQYWFTGYEQITTPPQERPDANPPDQR